MPRSFYVPAVSLRLGLGLLIMGCLPQELGAQQAFTWDQLRDKFESSNPTLRAGEINIAESRAQEITGFLRPNPEGAIILDQVGNTASGSIFSGSTLITSFSYLHERQHKRELRRDSAQAGTEIAESSQEDQKRTLLFNLRNAFVQTLQAKAILALARDNLAYYDQALSVNRTRFQAGDISQIDLNRLELQRVQYQSDLETSSVALRTAKIQMLTLLNDRTPVEQFDVTGPFDFVEQIQPLEEVRRIAQDTRPDLKAAVQAIDKARIDHQLAMANGSTDPTFGIDAAFPSISQAAQSFQPPLNQYVGLSISVPLRIFDRNQGEKLRTQLDIGRNEQLRNATEAQVFSDVDSAYATVLSNVNLLRPYKEQYLAQSLQVRDTISFSYQQGAASLLDFLNAQNDYRTTQRAYLTLIGSYLTAAAQLNLAVGREVIP
jgi:cobalt-zinc-cadmium efflux system outer membrane protein